MFRVLCSCGKESSVLGSQAGCQLVCSCLMKNQVPPLSQLKSCSTRGEAAVAEKVRSGAHSSLTSEESAVLPQQFCHFFGEIGPEGEVSTFATNHYVSLSIM